MTCRRRPGRRARRRTGEPNLAPTRAAANGPPSHIRRWKMAEPPETTPWLSLGAWLASSLKASTSPRYATC
jgi:hypothetical protein